jgi:hypothetical protein
MKTKIIFAIIITLSISSCGAVGGKGSNNPLGAAPVIPVTNFDINARFIDSPVVGLDYIREDGSSGFTDASGGFKCIHGEVINFFVAKNIYIGKSICNESIFIEQLNSTDMSTIDGIAAFLIKLNTSDNLANKIDLSSLLPATVQEDIFSLMSTSNSSLVGISSSVNEIINMIKPNSGDFDDTSLIVAKNEARDHINQSVTNFSNVIQSQRTTIGTFTHWLENSTISPRIIDLDGTTVSQTDASGSNPNSCPQGDLSGLSMSFSAEGATETPAMTPRKYYLGVGFQGSVLSKTRILSKRAVNYFEIKTYSEAIYGSISVLVKDNFQGVTGLIVLNIRNTIGNAKLAHCEYYLSI